MLLSKIKISNIKKAEQHTLKFYSDNFFSSYKFPDVGDSVDPSEFSVEFMCLAHIIAPICHAIKLVINLCRLIAAIFDFFICYGAGDKANKEAVKENLKNTALLVLVNLGNILMSTLSFIPRLIKTIVDICREDEELIKTSRFKKENKFFKNIFDVAGCYIPDGKPKNDIRQGNGIVVKAINDGMARLYEPGF